MRTMISHHLVFYRFPSSFPKINCRPTFYFRKECLRNPQNTVFTSFRASCTPNSAASYNGWDDLRVWVDSAELGESNFIKKFLLFVGIGDKKYAFTCMLGFVVALAISRVRVSSIVVFPAAFIVFAIGFSFGFVNGGVNQGFSSNWGEKRRKDEFLGGYAEKLRTLEKLFHGFDVRVGDLKSSVKKAIDDERIELSELEGYVDGLESIDGLVLDARNVVEDCVLGLEEVEKKLIQKNSRKKKETGRNGFDLFGFLGSFLRDQDATSKINKRNMLRRDSVVKDSNIRAPRALRGLGVEEAIESVSTMDGSTPRMSDNGRKYKLGEKSIESERMLRGGKLSEMEEQMNSRSFVDDGNGRFDYQRTRFVDNQSFSFNMLSHREIRKWTADDSTFTEFDITKEHQESENFLRSQQFSGNFNGAHEFARGSETRGFGSYKSGFSEERIGVEDELHTRKYQPQTDKDTGPFPSSTVSDDAMFSRYLTKGNDLLKQAKVCFKVRNDDILAEELLLESARLLSQAIAMKPMSLLAIGQLGNTYLLHGEVKLKTSRTLRDCLSKNVSFGVLRQGNLLSSMDETLPDRDRVNILLGKTCEECEALLVEAGRKYRTALSIDGNDLRALYNWGLALSFRAQLIADIGPEAALDADNLFLAAIDKFDAMMSRSNAYAPDALFRWGVALQQRSRLRPSSSGDKVKLLQQAKRLYKDALDMGSNNIQVREALSSCMSELNFSDI